MLDRNLIGLATMIQKPVALQDSSLNPAAWAYKRLCRYIRQFEAKLDAEHEIGARLVCFGSEVKFHIENLGYYGPDMICFYGIDEHGQSVQLIQHISQLSVLLIALKKQDEKPRRIGFKISEDTDSTGDESSKIS